MTPYTPLDIRQCFGGRAVCDCALLVAVFSSELILFFPNRDSNHLSLENNSKFLTNVTASPLSIITRKNKAIPCNRPWSPIGL
jgi:hypothetical protein